MKKISIIMILFLVGCVAGKEDFQNQNQKLNIKSNEALISRNNDKQSIRFSIDQPSKHSDNGILYISVEHLKNNPVDKMECFLSVLKNNNRKDAISLKTIEKEALNVTFPPGPDESTNWKVFTLNLASNSEFLSNKIAVSIEGVEGAPFNFTRIIIGKPATINSKLIGAFHPDARSLVNGNVIKAGTDLLGTKSASQYMRLPADIFGNGSKSFAGMVEFKETPFGNQTTNADTEMVRTQNITPGGTTPIKLVNFINTTLKPISVETDKGPILVTITARLSPSVESNGFITVNNDGSYQSTTMLFPVLTLQQVDSNGKAINDPVIIDTAVTQIPGYPFYLASNGGKWTEGAPSGRLVLNNSSNFFYDNGEVNNFIHSNGPGIGVLGACAKASVNAAF